MRIKICVVAFALCVFWGGSALAQQAADSFVSIPSTVSASAQEKLRKFPDVNAMPEWPDADDVQTWKALQELKEHTGAKVQKALIDKLRSRIVRSEYGGVPVLEVTPDGWKDNGKVVVYFHGGAYTFFSAESTKGVAAMIADATGLRVVSVSYTLAPHAKWQQVTEQAVSLLRGLQDSGVAMRHVAVIGDSAGGGLTAGTVLKMRDAGMEMPAAVVLWSPWSDITDAGDTYTTLKHAEPSYQYGRHLKKSADAYADPAEQKHPYVSPVYGDYSKGFPPTLIQGGTKEIFLSNFVRHYQALDTAGVPVKLDIYEGMPHVFQIVMPDTPEAVTARQKAARFLNQHLGE